MHVPISRPSASSSAEIAPKVTPIDTFGGVVVGARPRRVLAARTKDPSGQPLPRRSTSIKEPEEYEIQAQ